MTPLVIIESAAEDGVTLSLSSTGGIKVDGDEQAVRRWQPMIREHKPAILAILRGDASRVSKPNPMGSRMTEVVSKLHADPGLRLVVATDTETDEDNVIVTVAIRDKGACELRMPKSRYDAFLLMELIDRYTTAVVLQ